MQNKKYFLLLFVFIADIGLANMILCMDLSLDPRSFLAKAKCNIGDGQFKRVYFDSKAMAKDANSSFFSVRDFFIEKKRKGKSVFYLSRDSLLYRDTALTTVLNGCQFERSEPIKVHRSKHRDCSAVCEAKIVCWENEVQAKYSAICPAKENHGVMSCLSPRDCVKNNEIQYKKLINEGSNENTNFNGSTVTPM